VRLYVGLAGYKQDVEFTDPAELAAQIAEAQTHTDGFIVFSYEDIAKKNVKSSLA
jgi:hypothetical protein